ncbi:MAG: hypothetical protein ACT4OG_09635 [Alphaproteobacteria bacterium]
MLRLILGTAAGIAAGIALVFILETANGLLFPAPPDIDTSDPAQLGQLVERLPLAAKIGVLISWGVASFGGGALASWLTRRLWPAIAVAAVLLAGGAWTMTNIPHPAWMAALGAVALIAPAIWAGLLFAKRNKS